MPCLKADGYPLWDAHCHTCDWSLAEEKADDDASIFTTREEASAWRANHRCESYVTLTDPNPPVAQAAAQLDLFPLTDLTAERTAA
ncbi:hypothetical protein E1286_24175 [Nonomuraea terrae]|uniref:Uncharacterized protein n=1 Tax=Nonomuraea terrae TaxID=2530383 RepID=A0A4R4YKC2_9ACTN|nr:hypothetical protein [Nonomuraea terrae]TDD45418.1 hypothetical protein E1286_24175 [Nonomuraea terrae]